MYFFLFLTVLVVIYVKSFEDNFTKEKLEKVAPIILIVLVASFVLCILSSILSNMG